MSKIKIIGNGEVQIGQLSTISNSAQFVFNKPGTVTIGDYCVIGPGVKIVCSGGDVNIGDWTTLHDNCLVLSSKYVEINQHCWFGQNCIIDGSGGLKIGRGVRVGMYSQIWSHVAAGEQIEGCTLFGERPVYIEDEVWLVGSCIVASGVTIGRRSVALIGSNITKSWPANTTLAGTPALQKTGLSFYKEVTLEEKWEMLRHWIEAATKEIEVNIDSVDYECLQLSDASKNIIIFVLRKPTPEFKERFSTATICCLEDKMYTKKFTDIEKKVLKYLAGNKARFYSLN